MTKITIFTPTYNRADKLNNLYCSLLRQTDKNFLWLIIDDGSIDQTADLIQEWIKEKAIEIRYVHQENQGKCAAIRRASETCDTAWMICVDSDDALHEDAVKIMRNDIHTCQNDAAIGVVYPRKMGSDPSIRWLPKNITAVDIMDCKNIYGITETAILIQTAKLREISFPHFEDEKFLSEEVLYIQLAQLGSFIPRKQAFYLSDYLETGITKNLFAHWVRNPRGTVLLLQGRYFYSRKYGLKLRIAQRVKCIMNLNALCMACGLNIFEHTPSKGYSLLLMIPSMLWRRIRF